MKKVKYKNITIEGEHFEELHVFYDNEGNLVVLPLLFSIDLTRTGSVYSFKKISSKDRFKTSEFEEKTVLIRSDISRNTETTYLGHLLKYLEYCESNSLPDDDLEHCTEIADNEDISLFLNHEYPNQIEKYTTLKGMKAAIAAYYNFLTHLGITNQRSIRIKKEVRKKLLEKEAYNFQIKYIHSNLINELLLAPKTKADNLIIQCGYRLGLRAKECAGLVLHGKDGLNEIVERYKKEENDTSLYPIKTEYFEYQLKSKYTKGGKSRFLYIPRNMIRDIEAYIETERADIVALSKYPEPDGLLLNASNSHFGKAISTKHASTVFRHLKSIVSSLNEYHSFHCLRHTFATLLYDKKIKEGNGKNDALREVANALGHSLDRNGDAYKTTTRYVVMRDYMNIVEKAA
ncbi:tyrosine-type recombinase/integrase [Pseudoalteromonas piratica]|uniref:Tyr recombinase domain-containing protein n=1 Tax=Pseudoalteromonas piratica TaxID=1348114 RepID=A0A0A7EHJ4_9GAMM|nr:site-specific integrase [Pseudoalteromonas piratica]AIY66105.1 hypothetical protein OM33_14025 [Pseudoalteromonas piratica]